MAKLCRMMGFDELSNNYRILTVPEGKILSHKDCIWDNNLLQYSLSELMSNSEHHKDLLQFSEPDIEIEGGKMVGDEVAPYFALTPEEYQDQADRDENEINEIPAKSGDSAAYFGLTSEQYEELVKRDQNNVNAVLECYFNDFALSVHAPCSTSRSCLLRGSGWGLGRRGMARCS
jgi:hypothetical protein